MAVFDSIGDMYSATSLRERQTFAQRMADIEAEEDGHARRERKGGKEQVATIRRLQRSKRRLSARLAGALQQLDELRGRLAERGEAV